MQAMDYLQDQGLTSHIGVSNFTVSDLEEAREHASHPITVNQIQYNLLTRNRRGHYTANMESDIIPYCREHGILIVAYEPLARAKLTRDVPELLKQIADKYEKTPAQLAINWLINKPGIVAIVKSSNKHHLEENLGALGWHMDPSDLEHLDAAFPN